MTSIGDQAFYGCRDLTSVTSEIMEPFAIDRYVFSKDTYNTAMLYVPVGTIDAYKATVGWKQFDTIKEIEVSEQLKGDVNGDLTVDVADIANVIDVMVQSGNDAAADVNKDGVVDVADIATIIDLMAANARKLEVE